MSPTPRRPSPALLVSVIALVAALAGSAVALPGRNSVDRNDLKKGAVTKRAIKKGAVTKRAIKKGAVTAPALRAGAVTTRAIADEAVTEAKLADGAVTREKLSAPEAPHVVGAPGEPGFANGGEGDCVWRNAGPNEGYAGTDPVSFYKDGFGTVHLAGIAAASDGPGGDGNCDPLTEIEDGIVFTLPPGYQPTGAKVFRRPDLGAGPGAIVIAPPAGATVAGEGFAGGVVFSTFVEGFLDGITFHAATNATPARRARIPGAAAGLR